MEPATNPSVLLLHTRGELTKKTIETCPPAAAPPPLHRLLSLPGIRSINLHRYRARLNLVAGATVGSLRPEVEDALTSAWGEPVPLPPPEPPRAFEVDHREPRVVAESPEMAQANPILRSVFEVEGVDEAVLGSGAVLVRLGRLFSWEEGEGRIRRALGVG